VNNFKTTTKLKSRGQQDFHTHTYLPHIFTQHLLRHFSADLNISYGTHYVHKYKTHSTLSSQVLPKTENQQEKNKKLIFMNSCWLQFYLVFWLLFSLVVVEGGKLSDGILAPGQGEPAPTLIPWLC
jgi:hypothetical protein